MDGEQLRGLRAAVVAFVLWGLLTLYWKQLADLDAFELIGWRVLSAATIMSIVLTTTGRWATVAHAFGNRGLLLRLGLAALLLSVNWTTFVWAVVSDHVIETALGYFLAPLSMMALGVLVLGERLTVLKRWSIGSALVAVIVLTVSYGRMPWIAFLIAGSWSWYGLTKRRVPLDPVESLASELFILLGPAVLVVASGFVRAGGTPHVAGGFDWVLLVGTGVITAVPLLLFAFAAQRVPFTVLGPANYLVPIINFLLGWLVFDETMTTTRFVGFAFVWVALVLVTIDTVRSHVPRQTAPVPIR